MTGRNCCNSITLQLIIFTNFHSVIGKYQTGVMSITCYWPTDAISDWTSIVWLASCRDVFLLRWRGQWRSQEFLFPGGAKFREFGDGRTGVQGRSPGGVWAGGDASRSWRTYHKICPIIFDIL